MSFVLHGLKMTDRFRLHEIRMISVIALSDVPLIGGGWRQESIAERIVIEVPGREKGELAVMDRCCVICRSAVIMFLCFCLSAAFVGCQSGQKSVPFGDFVPTADDRLTPKEKEELIEHARNFVSMSKNVKLTDAERKEIKRSNPSKFDIFYSGHKRGIIKIEWKLESIGHVSSDPDEVVLGRVVRLTTSDGKLLRDRNTWMLKILTDYSAGSSD